MLLGKRQVAGIAFFSPLLAMDMVQLTALTRSMARTMDNSAAVQCTGLWGRSDWRAHATKPPGTTYESAARPLAPKLNSTCTVQRACFGDGMAGGGAMRHRPWPAQLHAGCSWSFRRYGPAPKHWAGQAYAHGYRTAGDNRAHQQDANTSIFSNWIYQHSLTPNFLL